MVLLFLITLSLLALAVAGEIEAAAAGPAATTGTCRCGQDLESDWLLCPRCRQRPQVSCSGCARPFFSGLRHCPACGRGRDDAAAR